MTSLLFGGEKLPSDKSRIIRIVSQRWKQNEMVLLFINNRERERGGEALGSLVIPQEKGCRTNQKELY